MPSYTINEDTGQRNRNNSKEDKSFKSCVCLLLIFITICAILFLVSAVLQKNKNTPHEEDSQVEYLENYKIQNTLNQNDKVVEITTKITIKEYEPRFDTTVEETVESTTPEFSTDFTPASTENKNILNQQSSSSTTTSSEPNVVTEELTQTTIKQDEMTEQISIIVSLDETENLSTTTEVAKSISTTTESLFVEFFKTTTLPEVEELTTTTENVKTTFIATSTAQISTTILPQMQSSTLFETTELEKEIQTVTSSNLLPTSTLKYLTSDYTPSTPLVANQIPQTTSEIPELFRSTQSMLQKTRPTCLTMKCKSVASSILYKIDPGQDPCEDFYTFACGGRGVSEYDLSSTREQQIADKIFFEIEKIKKKGRCKYVEDMARYYEVCVKNAYEEIYDEKLSKVKNILKSMNLYYLMKPQELEGVQNVTWLFEKMILMQLSPIFDINVGLGFSTGTKYRIEISPSSLYSTSSVFMDEGTHTPSDRPMSAQTLFLRRRCFSDLQDRISNNINPDDSTFGNSSAYRGPQDRIACLENYREAFVDSVLNISSIVLDRSHYVGLTDMEIELKKELIDILQYADKILLKLDPADTSVTVDTVENLEMLHPIIIWVGLFGKLTSRIIEQNTKVYWKQKDALQEMFIYLQKFPTYKIYNTFLTLFAMDLYVNLVEPQTNSLYVRNRCQMEAISLFPHISSDLYLKSVQLADQEAMDEFLEDIFTQLKTNLTGSLQGADWLDERSKISCISTLDELSLYLTNDELSLNEDEINDLYKNVNISDNYVQNYVDMVSLKRTLSLQLYGQKFKTQHVNGFLINSFDIEPISIIAHNLIVIPMGMFDTLNPIGTPRFLVMARIGIHVAMEMGRRFDPVGITEGISLSQSSTRSYDAFLTSAVDQYTYALSSIFNDVKLMWRSQMTLNSRIADSTAFRLVLDAFDSYQELETLPWLNEIYSNEEIYIIATIQEFCKKTSHAQNLFEMFESPVLPPKQRVENMVKNTMPFTRAFKCPEGVKMNAPLKLQFPYVEAVDSDDDYQSEYGTLQ